MTKLADMEYLCHRWPGIRSVCCSYNYVCPVSFMTYHLIRNMSNTTGVTNGAGTFYPSRTQWFIAGLFLVWFKSLVYPLISLNCSLFVEPHQWCNGKRVCWCVVAVRCEPRSYQLKDYKIGIYCYIANHATYMGKSRIKIMCPNGPTYLLADYWLSKRELSKSN